MKRVKILKSLEFADFAVFANFAIHLFGSSGSSTDTSTATSTPLTLRCKLVHPVKPWLILGLNWNSGRNGGGIGSGLLLHVFKQLKTLEHQSQFLIHSNQQYDGR